MKKLLCILITVTMLFSCTIVASASDVGTFVEEKKEDALIYEGENKVFMIDQEKAAWQCIGAGPADRSDASVRQGRSSAGDIVEYLWVAVRLFRDMH